MADWRRIALSLGLGGFVAMVGWQRRALSHDGAVVAAAVGAATFGCGGLPASFGLVAFFATGSALSRRTMVPGEVPSAKGHRRDAVQVLANGGAAAAALTAAALGWPGGRAAALGALAAAAADTWASEIGVRSQTPPRSIVSGKVVQPGTSGGVTALGWLAAMAGALTVGVAWAAADGARWSWLAPALAAGLAGSLADSLAGATIQAGYRCQTCSVSAEAPGLHCGQPRRLLRGWSWVTNDVVNLLGTVFGAMVGAALGSPRASGHPAQQAQR